MTNQYSFSDYPGRLRPRRCTDEVACEPSHDIGNNPGSSVSPQRKCCLRESASSKQCILSAKRSRSLLPTQTNHKYGRAILSRCHSEAVHSDAMATGSFPPKPANALLSPFLAFCKEIYEKKNVSFFVKFFLNSFSKIRKYQGRYRTNAKNCRTTLNRRKKVKQIHRHEACRLRATLTLTRELSLNFRL
jgi:hypothetical protein